MTKKLHTWVYFIRHMAAFDAAEGKKMLVSTKIEYIGEKLEYCCVFKGACVFFVCTILSLIDCGCGLQN